MRKPSDADLRTALTVGHFGSDAGPLPPADPLTPTAMVVLIGQIDSYDRNPRIAPNEKYEELKESIGLNGLRQPLVITRRPGAARYMPKHGGNTRLVILKELLIETGDARFAAANCLFEPWSSESDVLVGHLVENEMRGDLVFIDKARAIRDARLLIEQETGTSLSQRQLAEVLRGRGYRASQPFVSYCEYAIDALFDAIPTALGAGLGRPQVERLRELDRAAQTVWAKRNLGPEELFRSIYSEALAAVDTESWEFDRARRSLEKSLADRAGAEPRHISLELGAELDEAREVDDLDERIRLAGRSAPIDTSGFNAEAPPPPPLIPPAPAATQGVQGAAIGSGASWRVRTDPASSPRTASSPDALKAAAGPARELFTPGTFPLPQFESSPASHDEPKSTDDTSAQIGRLRKALRDCALEYARQNELTYCLRFEGSPWIRLGYVVADFPASAQLQQLHNDFGAREALAWKWYELTRCCDLLPIAGHIERLYGQDPEAKQRVFAELFGSNPRYLNAWTSPDAFLDAIADSVGIMDLQQFSFYAERVNDEAWQAGTRMVQAYRDLKSYAYDAGIDLMQDTL